jgi:voltage-gated potassium channel
MLGPVDRMGVDSSQYRRVVYGLAGLSLVLSIGTAGFILIEGWSFLDALYMTVTTVTTVGFSEVKPLSPEGRLFTIGLVLVGVGIAFYILTAMVAAIIEGDLRLVFGARRLRSALDRLNDHHIVCGYGRVGEEVARELRDRKVSFVVLDRDAGAVERARADGMLAIQGDATSEDALKNAGIMRCRSLIAASDSDAANTYITLTARGLRGDIFVVTRVSTTEVTAKLRQAGASRVVSPYAIGGRRMALAAIQPIMADFIDIVPDAHGDRILAEFLIDDSCGLVGRQISVALAGCRDVVALAVRDTQGRMTVGPAGSTLLAEGDRLVVVGEEDDLRSIGGAVKGLSS